mgnify:CR=1 FL=1
MIDFVDNKLLVRCSEGEDGHYDDDYLIAIEVAKPKLKPPQLYKVVLHNDDYTPMDFVVELLGLFFAMSREKATGVMLKVHLEGKAVCGVYSKDIAETKCAQVNQYARENEHPLLCEVEPAEAED